MEKNEVMAFLEPWFGRIQRPFHVAMKLYNDDYPSKIRVDHNDSVAAQNVHSHIISEFEKEFANQSGCQILDVRGLKVLNIRDRIVARMKKVDSEGRHRNADTKQQRDFDRQMQLPGLPEAALRLTFGYEPDLAFSICERIIIARPQGKSTVWNAQIVEEEGKIIWVDITPQRFTGTEINASGIRFSKQRK